MTDGRPESPRFVSDPPRFIRCARARDQLDHTPVDRIEVAGRVVFSEPGSTLIADDSGTLEVGLADPVPIGSFIEVALSPSGASVIHLGAPPMRPFPVPDGDWLAVHGGRRLEALKARAALRTAVRAWYEHADFLEVETPIAVPSPGLDLHLDAVEARGLGAPRWLGTSPEYQMKRLLAAGLPRIVQLQRCFRRGERGARHEPEFTLLEWYRAPGDADDVMRDTEHLVASCAESLLGSTVIPARGRPVDVSPPWERVTVAEAFQRYAGVSVTDVLPDEERFFRILIEDIEPHLGHPHPVFLTRWPASMASLARLCPDDTAWAERFEAYVDGMELCNGFGELIDPVEQRARLVRDREARRSEDLPAYPLDERFVGALEEGIPRAGGNALGFDRLLMLLLGLDHIEQALPFPQSRL
ncbi:MAG: EF-P lysine aminoacylase EpmA [Sandaracinaceae bacterium]